MATCRQVITSALRKLQLVNEGQAGPVAYDAAGALEVLQAWYEKVMATGLFGRLTDVTASADYEAKEFERVTNISGSPVTVTLPTTVTDTETGLVRVPIDLCPVVVLDPAALPLHYIYDGHMGGWIATLGLGLDDEAPLSRRGSDGLACVLAIQLSDQYGGVAGQLTSASAVRFLSSLSQRNSSARRSVDYEYM